MNTRNTDDRPRRWFIVIFISLFLFNINGAHAEDLKIREYQNDVKPVMVGRIDDMKETEKCIQRKTKEEERKRKLERSKSKWESLGDCRITYYCPCCNDPTGYGSSSGETLQEGYVACSWLSNGTKIKINGTEYTVMDCCGTEAIDIFVDTDACYCNDNYYTEVKILRE